MQRAKPNPTLSDYFRALQRRATQARWAGTTPAERSAAMRRVRAAARKRKEPNHEPTRRLS